MLSVPVLLGYDQKVLGQFLGKQPGGAGGSVACAASRLGLRTGLILDSLGQLGVDITHVVVEPNTNTNFTTVFIDRSGEKAIIIVPTAFNTLSLDPSLTT